MRDDEIRRYHSRKAHLNFDDADEIWAVIAQAKYAVLSMVKPDGEPCCMPLSLGWDRNENCLYFHTGFVGEKIEALRAHPRACALILRDDSYLYGQCRHRFQSVICTGVVRELDDEAEKRAALVRLFHCLEGDHAEQTLRLRKVDGMPMSRVNILRMDIDGFSGKRTQGEK